MSEASEATVSSRVRAVERATGRPWAAWLRFMESIDAPQLDHHQIALRVYEELDGSVQPLGWWVQAVTVAYEQHVGRRVPGQRPDGTFQTSVSRSTPLPMEELMRRWQDFAVVDGVVQEAVDADTLRVSGTERRITWRARARDGSAVVVTSEPKKHTATLVATQIGLASAELNDEARQRWTDVVERFLELLRAA